MTSPVSIGDAFLMAKLALKLGRAFTTGRKSAPAEFREVESQLYSISTALSSLHTAYKFKGIPVNAGSMNLASLSRDGQRNGENPLKEMLEGCEETLKHLEKVVEKYTVVFQPRNPEAPSLRKWSRDLRNNWKKVLWTTEGGDMDILRSNLTVHINCLNLVLGVVNQVYSVLMPGAGIYEFEKSFIDILGAAKARSMLRRNMGTFLAYTTTTEPDKMAETRILHLMGRDLQSIQKKVENITFAIGRQSYQRTVIESIQLLHYKALRQDRSVSDSVIYSEDLTQVGTAELVIFYGEDSSGTDVKQTTLHLDMKLELFVMSLSEPRHDERLALKLRAKGVHTERVDIASSEISIMQSQTKGRLRLIIVSDDGLTVLSQECASPLPIIDLVKYLNSRRTVAEDFLKGSSGKPNFASPTYVVQIVGNGTREIYLYDKGFKFFEFSDAQTDRLLSLGLAAVSGANAPAQRSRGLLGIMA
ncbi:hypothetical protein DL764_009356 [Monosporascus ibericus]|uniref:Fungal N-terminal domain-containing protein n=1 Tax=Monosporascus ibericus TaxID=155417 RepID=A0A4Q4SXG9_9PEZI|nr:hypothetical protein DL764_009356 [Monosporascus ibericus]